MLGCLRKLHENEEGSFIIIFAFTVLILIGVTGAALDFARGHLLKSELTSAVDAAALAGGAAANSENLQEIIVKYFNANFPQGYLGATTNPPEFILSDDGDVLTVKASANLDYSLLSVFIDGQMEVAAFTEVTLEKRGLEIVLVMDNTGSMLSNNQIGAMKHAALGLIDILYGDNNEVDDLYVGLVPYVASVNVGKQYTGWIGNLNQGDFYPSTWKGCVSARDLTDKTPTEGGKWNVYRWPSQYNLGNAGHNRWICSNCNNNNLWPRSSTGSSSLIWRNGFGDCPGYRCWINENNSARDAGGGPNKSCASPITPLTTEKSTIVAGINAMESWADGGTLSDVGLAWGWRVISPEWKGLWDGVDAEQPFDYDEQLIDKVVVLLTDGNNDVGNSMSAYGIFPSNSAAVVQEDAADANVGTLCTAMKSEGIIIYTITFNVSGDIQQIYEDCATSKSHYFDSPSNDQLDGVFEAIGDSLSNLRISR